MAADTIIIKYKADTAKFSQDVKVLTADITKVGVAGDKAGDKTAASFNKAALAIDKTGKQSKQTTSAFNGMGAGLANIAATMGVAFGAQQIIQFGKASAEAFIDAEKNAQLLLFALKGNEAVQGRLMAQASELQNTTIYDDDSIQQAQTFLANQGRTEDQIKKVIDAAVELSTVTGVDLNTAVMQLDGTFEGNIGKMGKLDSAFKKLTKEQLANGAAADLLIEKYGGTAKAMGDTTAGQVDKLKNQFGELQETIGGSLVPELTSVMDAFKKIGSGDILGGLEDFYTGTLNQYSGIGLYIKGYKAILELEENGLEKLQNVMDAFDTGGISAAFDELKKSYVDTFNDIFSGKLFNSDKAIEGLTDFEKAAIQVANSTDKEITAKFEELGGATNATAMEFKKFTDDMRSGILKQTFDDLSASLDISKDKFKELTDQTDKYGISVRVTADAIMGLRNATTDDLVATFKEAKAVIKDLTWDAFKEYVKTIKEIPPLTDDITKSTEKAVGPWDALNNRIGELNKQMMDAITLGKDYTKIEMQIIDLIKQRDSITRDAANSLSALNQITRENNDVVLLNTEHTETNFEAIKKVNDAKLLGIIATMQTADANAVLAKQMEKDAEIYGELAQLAKTFNQALTQIFGEAAENSAVFLAFQKAIAIAEIALSSAQAIAAGIAAIAKGSATGDIASIISGITSITAGIGNAIGGLIQQVNSLTVPAPPQFFEGTDYLQLNGNPKGKDTIPVMAHEGEAIIPTDRNLSEPGLASAWINGNLDKYVIDKWVSPALINQEKEQKREFANDIATSMMLQSGAAFDDYRLYRLGVDQVSLLRENNSILGKFMQTKNPWAV